MLSNIRVKSFKSLEDVDVELGLVNVFIGANGSGKSNLLEAVGVLGAAASGRVDDEALLRRGVRPGLPELYKSSFRGSRQPKEIFFAGKLGKAQYSVSLYNPMKNPEPSWRFKSELLCEGKNRYVGRSPRSKIRLDPALGYAALKAVELEPTSDSAKILDELQRFAIYSPDTATLRGLDSDPQTREPLGLNGGRLAEAIHDVFRNKKNRILVNQELFDEILTLIGWAEALGSSSGPNAVPVSPSIPQPTRILRFTDKFMAHRRNLLSAYDASEGALYVLFMMALIHHEESPPIAAVDNFDHALNPRLAKALTKLICSRVIANGTQQLLLTSHNPLVLDGLPLQDSRVRLFAVQRTRSGKTVVKRISVDESLLRNAERGVSLSQQWVMGSLGGVPKGI